VPTDKDRKQVTIMAGIGLKHDHIAKIIGISDETLRKYYGEELELAAAKMNAQVAQNLYSIATSKGPGAVPSAIFWMKTRGGWREVERKEITGANGAPIQLESKRTVSLDNIDDETLQQIEHALRIALENKTDQ
jgi:hypothetical protein